MTDRQKMYHMTIQELVKDAENHGEVLMIGLYGRDASNATEENPTGRGTYSLYATNHTEYDRAMYPHLMQQQMLDSDIQSTVNSILKK